MKHLKHVIAAGILGSAAQLASAAGLPGPLVTPQWVHEHLGDVTLVDIRDDMDSLTAAPKYEVDKKTGAKKLVAAGGHLANVISVDFNKIREAKTVDGKKIVAQLPTAEYFTKVMDEAGLNKGGKPIVIVPEGNSVDSMDMATRLYFQLRYFGEPRDNVAVMNGGVASWLQDGFPVSTDKVAASKGDWAAGKEDGEILATMQQVNEGLQKGSEQFVDARPTAQFLGLVKKPIIRTFGHLPGAHSLPTDAIVKPEGVAHVFMTPVEYKKIYAEFNIQPGASTVTYCNTGHLASGAWFVDHEILGNAKTKLYAGSMVEWTNMGHDTVGVQ